MRACRRRGCSGGHGSRRVEDVVARVREIDPPVGKAAAGAAVAVEEVVAGACRRASRTALRSRPEC